MFLVFHGRGWLVPITAIGSIAACALGSVHDPRIIWSAMAASGLIDRYFGRKWNSGEGKLLQDLRTGEVHEVKPDHSFFWIPLQHWLWVKIGLAVVFIFIALSHTS